MKQISDIRELRSCYSIQQYSVSAFEHEAMRYILAPHEIQLDPRNVQYLEVDRLGSGQLAKQH